MSAQMIWPNTKSIDTKQFKINVQGQDTEWYLLIYPNGDRDEALNHVSIYLELAEGNVPITVKYALHVVGKNGRKTQNLLYSFTENGDAWGEDQFISHEELGNPELGYLQNDTLNIQVDMCVLSKEKSSTGACGSGS